MIHVSQEQIDQAITHLENGDIILYPTETSYALGCDATNAAAVEKLYRIKKRAKEKAFPIVLPTRDSAHEYVEVTPIVEALAETHWPGPLNVVARTKEGSPVSALCAHDGYQSVRVSSHPIASMLVRRFGRPVVATSANISGEDALYSVKLWKDIFIEEKPNFVLEGGELKEVPASTTVKIVGDELEVLRQGVISIV